jgi:hypothetical protein
MEPVYKVVELIGTSKESWEQAAQNAIETASDSLRDIRIAEVAKQDIKFESKDEVFFRTKLKVSFKYQDN